MNSFDPNSTQKLHPLLERKPLYHQEYSNVLALLASGRKRRVKVNLPISAIVGIGHETAKKMDRSWYAINQGIELGQINGDDEAHMLLESYGGIVVSPSASLKVVCAYCAAVLQSGSNAVLDDVEIAHASVDQKIISLLDSIESQGRLAFIRPADEDEPPGFVVRAESSTTTLQIRYLAESGGFTPAETIRSVFVRPKPESVHRTWTGLPKQMIRALLDSRNWLPDFCAEAAT